MTIPRLIPDNPLKFIRRCIKRRKVFWTYHVNMRLKMRSISREMILSSVNDLEIIEQYLEDKYFPSYLMISNYNKIDYHLLIAVDVTGDNVRVVTTYLPNPQKWEPGFKIRRKNK